MSKVQLSTETEAKIGRFVERLASETEAGEVFWKTEHPLSSVRGLLLGISYEMIFANYRDIVLLVGKKRYDEKDPFFLWAFDRENKKIFSSIDQFALRRIWDQFMNIERPWDDDKAVQSKLDQLLAS